MDLYAILGLARTASKEEIKQAFREKALKHHPDRHAHEPESIRFQNSKIFEAASEAHEILTDDTRREVYNRSGKSAAPTAGTSGRYARPNYKYGGTYGGGASHSYSGATRTTPRRGLWSVFTMVAARSSRGDALFHLAMLGCVLGGGLFAGNIGDHVWQSSNQGKLFADVEHQSQMRKERQRCEQMHSATMGVKKRTEPPAPSSEVLETQAPPAETQVSKQQSQPSPVQLQQQQEQADARRTSEPEGEASAQCSAEQQGAEQSQVIGKQGSQPSHRPDGPHTALKASASVAASKQHKLGEPPHLETVSPTTSAVPSADPVTDHRERTAVD